MNAESAEGGGAAPGQDNRTREEDSDELTKTFLITTQAKRNLSSRSGIGGVRSAT